MFLIRKLKSICLLILQFLVSSVYTRFEIFIFSFWSPCMPCYIMVYQERLYRFPPSSGVKKEDDHYILRESWQILMGQYNLFSAWAQLEILFSDISPVNLMFDLELFATENRPTPFETIWLLYTPCKLRQKSRQGKSKKREEKSCQRSMRQLYTIMAYLTPSPFRIKADRTF